MVNFAISRLHWPVTALGPGHRIGLWFQGCSIGCKGCCSHDTWVATADHTIALSDVLDWVRTQSLDDVDGFSISGGEPFDQPDALLGLLLALRNLPARGDAKLRDILIYSGHPWHRLQRLHRSIVMLADAVISEPFVHSLPGEGLLGSANQRLHFISELGRARYGDQATNAESPAMQVHFDGRQLWMIGIPRHGDLDRLQSRLSKVGVTMNKVSWLA